MPLYEYECSEHGRFEVRQSFSDGHKVNCPKCSRPAQLRISLSSFRFCEPFIFHQQQSDGSYKEIGRKPDAGIIPKEGEPYPIGG